MNISFNSGREYWEKFTTDNENQNKSNPTVKTHEKVKAELWGMISYIEDKTKKCSSPALKEEMRQFKKIVTEHSLKDDEYELVRVRMALFDIMEKDLKGL